MDGELRAIRLVAGREIREAMRRKTIWITAGLLLLGTSLLLILPEVLGGDDEHHLGVVGETSDTFDEALDAGVAATDLELTVRTVGDVDLARSLLEDEELDVAVEPSRPLMIVRADHDPTLQAVVRQALERAAAVERLIDQGLSDDEITAALQSAAVEVIVVDEESGQRQGVASAAAVALYLLLFSLTNQVANSVAIEKSHRVSEVLLPVVPARALLLGKVAGTWVVAIVPLLAAALPLVARFVTSGSLPSGAGTVLAAGALWYLLGAALFLLAAGALASLVERQEEVGSALAGLSLVLIGSYFAGLLAPDSAVATVLAYVPFSSPMVEPVRLAISASSPAEAVVSAVALAAGVVVTARLATVVYRRAIVRTGGRLRLRQVLGRPSPGDL